MGLENDLYEELYLLRDEIRQDRLASGRREPQICSDEALREMAQRVPIKPKDQADAKPPKQPLQSKAKLPQSRAAKRIKRLKNEK